MTLQTDIRTAGRTDNGGQDLLAHPRSDQSHHCALTESVKSSDCMDGEQSLR